MSSVVNKSDRSGYTHSRLMCIRWALAMGRPAPSSTYCWMATSWICSSLTRVEDFTSMSCQVSSSVRRRMSGRTRTSSWTKTPSNKISTPLALACLPSLRSYQSRFSAPSSPGECDASSYHNSDKKSSVSNAPSTNWSIITRFYSGDCAFLPLGVTPLRFLFFIPPKNTNRVTPSPFLHKLMVITYINPINV